MASLSLKRHGMTNTRPGAHALQAAIDDARQELFGDEPSASQALALSEGKRLAQQAVAALRGDPKAPIELLLLIFARCNNNAAMQWGLLVEVAQALRPRK